MNLLLQALSIRPGAVFWGNPATAPLSCLSQSTARAAVDGLIKANATTPELAAEALARIAAPPAGPWRWSVYFTGEAFLVDRLVIVNSPGGRA